MDRPTDELVQRMLAAVLERFGGDEAIDRLLSGAREEAEAEVRELLKGAIKATLLQRAVSRLEWQEPRADAPPAPVTAEGEASGETVCYVYGITRAGSFDLPPGIPTVASNATLKLVRHDDLIAVTSDVALAEFGAEAVAERATDLDWVEQKVRAHDLVVKAMLGAGPVIPCRFCTIVRSARDVRQVLQRNRAGLSETLDALDRKKEWGVKIYAARGAADQDREFASGKSYFLEKKREQSSRADSARALRAAAEACHAEMSAAAADAARLRAPDAGAGTTRDVVLNAAYLVADSDTVRFHALASELSQRYAAQGLSLELTGPWPPYNFVSLDLSVEARADETDEESGAPETDTCLRKTDAGPEAAA